MYSVLLRFVALCISSFIMLLVMPCSLVFAEVLPGYLQTWQQAAKTCLDDQNFEDALTHYQKIIDNYPNHPETLGAWTGLVICSIGQRDFMAAQKAAEVLLTRYPDRPEAAATIRELANHYLWSHEHAKARFLFRAIVDRWPGHSEAPDAWAGLGICAIIQKDFTAAQQAAEALLARYPDRPEAAGPIRAMANHYLWSQESARARPLFQAIADRWPNCLEAPDAWAGLAICAIIQKDFTTAQQAAEALLTRYPDRPEVAGPVRAIANHYLWSQQHARAADLFQAMVDRWPVRPETVRAWAGLAICAIENNDFTTAQNATEAILTRFPHQPEVVIQIRALTDHYFWAGKAEESFSLFQKIVDRWPDYQMLANEWPNESEILEAWIRIAYFAIQIEDYSTADAVTNKILSDFSRHSELRNAIQTLAEHYQSIASNSMKARDLYKYWLDKFSLDPEAFRIQCLVVLAWLAENDVQNADEAMGQFKRLCKGKSDVLPETERLIKAYMDCGHPDRSIELCRWYTDLSTDHLNLYLKEYSSRQEFKVLIRDALGFSNSPEIKFAFLDALIRKAAHTQSFELAITMYMELCDGTLGQDAFKTILQAVVDNQNPPEALVRIVDICNRHKMSSVSVQLCHSYLAEYPESESRPYLLLKTYESMLLGGEAAAVVPLLNAYLDDSVSDNPELNVNARIIKGQAYLQMSDPAKAELCFREAIEEYPSCNSTSRATFFLASCYLMQNDIERARTTLQALVKNYPDSEYSVRAREFLNRIANFIN